MNDEYEYQRNQILNDPGYSPALRQWALKKLEQVHQNRELFDFNLNHPDEFALDPVVVKTDPAQVVEVTNGVIKVIVSRIIDDYSASTPYEMIVLAPPFLSPYGGDLDARLILDDFVPNDTIFVLTKSVGDKIFIKPADKLRWDEFYFRVVLWQQRKVGDPPKLEVTAPHLQGKITIIDDRSKRRP